MRYEVGYTGTMKTAISLPDVMFDAAERYAKSRGLTRSQLYRLALEEFLDRYSEESVTEALNRVYSIEDSGLDPLIKAAQLRSLRKVEWKE